MDRDQEPMSGEAEEPSPLETVEDGVPPALQVGGGLPHMVRALRHRDFRLVLVRQLSFQHRHLDAERGHGLAGSAIGDQPCRILAGHGGLCLQPADAGVLAAGRSDCRPHRPPQADADYPVGDDDLRLHSLGAYGAALDEPAAGWYCSPLPPALPWR